MDVIIERRERDGTNEVRVGVRTVADGRVLFACVGRGFAGVALAMVEAQSFAGREGHHIVLERVVLEQRVRRRARRAA